MARKWIIGLESPHSAWRKDDRFTCLSIFPWGRSGSVLWRFWGVLCLLLWLTTPAEAGWLGVQLRDGAPDPAAGPAGLLVGTVIPGSPAAEAGIQPGDRILAIQGRPILGAQETVEAIRALAPGTPLQLKVVRAGGERTLTVTLGIPPSAPPQAASNPTLPAASRAAATPPAQDLPLAAWRDPGEGAFTLSVPRGWQVTGGVHRSSPIDVRLIVREQSPDGHIQVFLDDPEILPRQVPNPMLHQYGGREGQIVQGPMGPILIEQYRTGVQFAQEYIGWKLCRQPQITEARPLPDQTNEMNARIVPIGRSQGAAAYATVGEAAFRCGNALGYTYATTLFAGPATGGGLQVWAVYKLAGFLVTNPAQAVVADYALDAMLGSFAMDPQWEARVMREANDATGTVTRMQQAMGQTIAQHASQAAAGGLNHPNPGVPWSLQDKWKHEAGPRQAFSNATLGTKSMCDASWGCRPVDTAHSNYFINNEGRVAPGSESGAPPDNSGQWRQMSPSQP